MRLSKTSSEAQELQPSCKHPASTIIDTRSRPSQFTTALKTLLVASRWRFHQYSHQFHASHSLSAASSVSEEIQILHIHHSIGKTFSTSHLQEQAKHIKKTPSHSVFSLRIQRPAMPRSLQDSSSEWQSHFLVKSWSQLLQRTQAIYTVSLAATQWTPASWEDKPQNRHQHNSECQPKLPKASTVWPLPARQSTIQW